MTTPPTRSTAQRIADRLNLYAPPITKIVSEELAREREQVVAVLQRIAFHCNRDNKHPGGGYIIADEDARNVRELLAQLEAP